MARIQVLFTKDQDKLEVSIAIHDFEALLSREKHLNPLFFQGIKVHPQNGMHFACRKTLGSFGDGPRQMGS